jgi:hypothetical protein
VGVYTLDAIKSRCAIDAADPDACWLWRGGTSNGHPTVRHEGRILSARRLTYNLTREKSLGEREVARMTCGNLLCINPGHMRKSSRAAMLRENAAQTNTLLYRQRMAQVGRGQPWAVLNPESAREIRVSADTAADLSRRYGVSTTTINRIRAGRMWRDYSALGAGRMT